jgi:molybdopterin molybdotransferase
MSELGPSPLMPPATEPQRGRGPRRHPRGAAAHHESETVPLHQALGRVLAADVVSPIDVPAHDNSAMDGYAFAGADLRPMPHRPCCAAWGTVYAGAPFAGSVGAGECLRIMTGAVMPAGWTPWCRWNCAACRRRRTCRIEPGVMRPAKTAAAAAKTWRRQRRAARRAVLRPADLGLAASLGFGRVACVRRLRVALFSTGNECARRASRWTRAASTTATATA